MGKGGLCSQLATGGWLSLRGVVSSQGSTLYAASVSLGTDKGMVKLVLTRRSPGCWPTPPPPSLPPCVCCSTPPSVTCMNGQCYFCSGCFWKALKGDTKKVIAWSIYGYSHFHVCDPYLFCSITFMFLDHFQLLTHSQDFFHALKALLPENFSTATLSRPH